MYRYGGFLNGRARRLGPFSTAGARRLRAFVHYRYNRAALLDSAGRSSDLEWPWGHLAGTMTLLCGRCVRREKHALVEYMKEHDNLTRQIHMLQWVESSSPSPGKTETSCVPGTDYTYAYPGCNNVPRAWPSGSVSRLQVARQELSSSWDGRPWPQCSVLFLSRPRSEGWPHHGRTFSIYLYPLSFWLTLPQRILSIYGHNRQARKRGAAVPL